MKQILLKGAPVEIDDYQYGDDYVDTYISAAHYVWNGKDLNDDELEILQDLYPELIYEAWQEHQIDRAEALRDHMEDR